MVSATRELLFGTLSSGLLTAGMCPLHLSNGLSCNDHVAHSEDKLKHGSMHHNAVRMFLLARVVTHFQPLCLLTQSGMRLAVKQASMPPPDSAITPCRKQQPRSMSMRVA